MESTTTAGLGPAVGTTGCFCWKETFVRPPLSQFPSNPTANVHPYFTCQWLQPVRSELELSSVSLCFSEHCTVWPGGVFLGKIGSCFECFPVVNNLSHCRMLNSDCLERVFVSASRLMCSTGPVVYDVPFMLHLPDPYRQPSYAGPMREVSRGNGILTVWINRVLENI